MLGRDMSEVGVGLGWGMFFGEGTHREPDNSGSSKHRRVERFIAKVAPWVSRARARRERARGKGAGEGEHGRGGTGVSQPCHKLGPRVAQAQHRPASASRGHVQVCGKGRGAGSMPAVGLDKWGPWPGAVFRAGGPAPSAIPARGRAAMWSKMMSPVAGLSPNVSVAPLVSTHRSGCATAGPSRTGSPGRPASSDRHLFGVRWRTLRGGGRGKAVVQLAERWSERRVAGQPGGLLPGPCWRSSCSISYAVGRSMPPLLELKAEGRWRTRGHLAPHRVRASCFTILAGHIPRLPGGVNGKRASCTGQRTPRMMSRGTVGRQGRVGDWIGVGSSELYPVRRRSSCEPLRSPSEVTGQKDAAGKEAETSTSTTSVQLVFQLISYFCCLVTDRSGGRMARR